MKRIFFGGILIGLSFQISAQTLRGYQFSEIKKIAETPVKSQDQTGTCWSFSTSSFLESEFLRNGKPAVDLSEMYIVRKIYEQKMRNYILRQGKANFSQGALALDVDLDRTYISLLERGLRQPSLKTIIVLADFLGVTPGEMVDATMKKVKA